MQLSAEQTRAVNDLLRHRGEACPQCGSRDVASTGEYYYAMNRRPSVRFACRNLGNDEQHPGGYGPYSMALEPYEARRIGLG